MVKPHHSEALILLGFTKALSEVFKHLVFINI